MENVMNSNERIAMMHNGIEGTGKHFIVNGESADTLLQNEQRERYNEGVEKIVDKFKDDNQALQTYAEQVKENINDLEILPMFGYVLIKPFARNPFQTMSISKSGIVTDTGGQAPEYKSNETGDVEEAAQFIKVGTVIETGHKCEFVQPGDVVFYAISSENTIPFFRQGFVSVAENRLMAVVNSKLTERRDLIRNGRQ